MHFDPKNMSKDLDPFYVSKYIKHIICSEVNDMFIGYPCMEAMLAQHMATTGEVGGSSHRGGDVEFYPFDGSL